MATKLVSEMAADDLMDRWRDQMAQIADDWIWEIQNRTRYRAVDRMLARRLSHRGRADQTRGWLQVLWATDASMAIRRALDDQQGVINIRHLLFEIEERSEVATRERFMEWARTGFNIGVCWCGYPQQRALATERFESLALVTFPRQADWDDGDRDHMAPAAVRVDRLWLETEAKVAFQYAQRLVAHRTPMKHHHIDCADLDRALDAIWSMVQKYYLALLCEPLTPKAPRPPRGWHRSLAEVMASAR